MRNGTKSFAAIPPRAKVAEASRILGLDARENLAGEMVYRRRELPVSVAGAAVRAITYVADRAHPAYGRHCPETTAWAIAHGHGEAGSNREYLENTLARLRALGLRDAGLERLARLVSAAGDAVHLDQRAAHQ